MALHNSDDTVLQSTTMDSIVTKHFEIFFANTHADVKMVKWMLEIKRKAWIFYLFGKIGFPNRGLLDVHLVHNMNK